MAERDGLHTIIARDHDEVCDALHGKPCDCGHTMTPAEKP